MDRLKEQRQDEIDRVRKKLDKVFPPDWVAPKDTDLSKYWEDAWNNAEKDAKLEGDENDRKRANAQARLEDLKAIKKHIEDVSQAYAGKVGANFTRRPIEERQDVLRGLSKLFASSPTNLETFTPDSVDLKLIKASGAYVGEWKRRSGHLSQFPYSVAMKHLCYMKATATGVSKTVGAHMEPALHTHKAWIPGSGKV